MNPFTGAGRTGVRLIDLVLRSYYHVFAFTNEPACLRRLSRTKSVRAIVLSDGTRIARGEPLLVLHLWNERLPLLPREGATLAWSIEFIRRLKQSLHLLAAHLTHESTLEDVGALFGELGFLQLDQFGAARLLVERLGFDFAVGGAPGWRFWSYAFWTNFYSWWLMWSFNPASLRGKHFLRMARCEIWMSRARLLEKYGERL